MDKRPRPFLRPAIEKVMGDGRVARAIGRGIGRDGPVEVETIAWDDGSYSVESRMIDVELIDPWHAPGYRIRIPVERPDRLPAIDSIAVGDVLETPDPVTRMRPSDVLTGRYVHVGTADDGTPRYQWQPVEA